MIKYILFVIVFFTLITACSDQNNIKSQLESATDSYLDIHAIRDCSPNFYLVKSDYFGKKELVRDSYYLTEDEMIKIIANPSERDNDLNFKIMYDAGLIVKDNNKLYFTDSIARYSKIGKDTNSRYDKINICFSDYKIDKILSFSNLDENGFRIKATFKVKYDYYPWYIPTLKRDKLEDLGNIKSQATTIEALFRKNENKWVLEKILNVNVDKNILKKIYKNDDNAKKLDISSAMENVSRRIKEAFILD